MAINYSRVNWDTTKSLGPTNMNKMDLGIKNACDGVDALAVQDYSSRFVFDENDYFSVTGTSVKRYGNMLRYEISVKTKQPLTANCNYFIQASSYPTSNFASGHGFIVGSVTTQGSNSYTAIAHYVNGKLHITPNTRGMSTNYGFTCTLIGTID